MAFILLKFLIIIYLTLSIMVDFSAYATCQDTNNCGSDSGQASVFPDILAGGDYNTAHGYHAAGMDVTSGDANTIVGYEAGKFISTGSYNVATGAESLNVLNTGSENTSIGYRAGYTVQGGSGNIFIGNLAGSGAANDVTNKLFIANSADSTPLIYGDFSNNTVTINDNLAITGTFTDGNYTFDTNGNVSGLGNVSSGNITSSGSITGNSIIIGNANISETELETIDEVTAGTVAASKAVVVDASNNISGFGTLTASIIKADTYLDSHGDRFMYKDTANDIVHIGTNSMLFYDSSTYGKDIMASSTGHVQIGKNSTDTTTIVGDLIIEEPTAAKHAATRRYADKVSLMAASLDTRLPLYGNKHALTLGSASTNNESAFGLNFIGIYDGLHLPLDISLGTAFSGDYNMGKLSVGMSW